MSTATEPKKELTQTAAWPSPDFEAQVQCLRGELETAVRVEKDVTQRIEALQNKADLRNLPHEMFREEFAKLDAEQSAAIRAVNEARDALRESLDSERAKFFAIRNAARLELQATIAAKEMRARQAAAELHDIVAERFGALTEIKREESQIAAWNRLAKRITALIPQVNANAVPSPRPIFPGEGLRNEIEQRFISDPTLREFCQAVLSRDAEKRQADEAREAQLAEQTEKFKNPMAYVPPFFDDKLKK